MNEELNRKLPNKDESVNIRVELEKYLYYWKWFVLSICICVFLSVIYAKSSVNIYKNISTLLIKSSETSSELDLFRDLSALGMPQESNVEDEVMLLKSRSLLSKVVKKLNLNENVYYRDGLKVIELYDKSRPFKLEIVSDEKKFFELDTIIDLHFYDNTSFDYELEGNDDGVKTEKFGSIIKIGQYEFLLKPNKNINNPIDVKLELNSISKTLSVYNKSIIVQSISEGSNIISISLNHTVREKAQLIINSLIEEYNNKSIEEKNSVGKKTDDFITKRLKVIKKELDEIDKLEEIYRQNEQLTDIVIQSQVYVDGKSLNEEAIFQNETRLRLIEFMIHDIKNQKTNFELLPANITAEDNIQLATYVNQYNELLFKRNRLIDGSYLENPDVQKLNRELLSLRNNIEETLNNTKKQLQIAINSLKEKESEFKGKISEIPKQAREYTSILRKQTIVAELYSYLLQKKQENEISMAVTVPDTMVVDKAYSEVDIVAPKKKIILLIGALLGLVLPFVIIFTREMLDTKFHSRAELEKHVSIPILGDIPFDNSEEKVIVKQGSRTSSAEAFRLLRTNLDFILSGVQNKSKVIFVTSTISGEGKTFISVNTAASIALTGKKVLLIGMDLRAPKITQYLGLPNRSGVSNYLIGQEDSITDLVFPLQGFENLDVLSSGIVPPNPAELLLNDRLGEMFDVLRDKFDYIVVDTAPVNLVTDTLMMSKHADMFIYVARANYIDKRMLEFSQKLYESKRLPNLTMLINGMDHARVYGYGVYGYGGYGYPDEIEKKNFFQKIFKS